MATFKKIALVSLLVILLIGGGIMAFLYYVPYSDGVRAGQVIKISKKGYVFKTHEGELNTGMNNPPWAFSVDRGNAEVLEKLEAASLSGDRVKLHYEEKFVQFDWRGDTKYFIVKVEKGD